LPQPGYHPAEQLVSQLVAQLVAKNPYPALVAVGDLPPVEEAAEVEDHLVRRWA